MLICSEQPSLASFRNPNIQRVVLGGGQGPEISVFSLETGERKRLLDGERPRYASSGHIVFQRVDSLYAVPFDLDRLEVTGSPTPLPLNVRLQLRGLADFAFSDTGSLVYLPADRRAGSRLAWVNRRGEVELLTESQRWFETPRLSPDGTQLAVTVDESGGRGVLAPGGTRLDVWIYEITRDILTQFTFDGSSGFAIWEPNGDRLTYMSRQTEQTSILWMFADESGEAENLINSRTSVIPNSWSPDGVLSYAQGPAGRPEIWMLSLEGERKPQSFLSPQFYGDQSNFSPDGKWVAFRSNRSGQDEVYVRPYPDEGGIAQISTNGGTQPVWAHSGEELFYREGDKMILVPVQTEPTFKAGRPTVLFEGSYSRARPGVTLANYDITPDDQRFIMVQEDSDEGERSATQINVVLNWFEELKRLVPTN